ncbi:hypothetical protein OIY81_515 [Cryptosporidium canis]|uniref:t-SNARE coiled-coil homology domain-containing protein n=1 Tax=Cryptosporidium canis TaxID=195482 RepID=A0ABQ8P6Z5_9CRYT|nr:hypothetical protein OJ252_1808 [Cryptosporidium canis]KAJ1614406.1 hypothetical protein OIY81_515 [Cryptosporidium canis]
MSWRLVKGLNDIGDLLKCLNDIELICLPEVKDLESSEIGSEYSKHKAKLLELYNTACTILNEIEGSINRPKLLLKVKLQDLIDQMKIELQDLKEISKKRSNSSSLKVAGNIVDYLEIDNYERDLVVAIQSRVNKLFNNTAPESTYSITLSDLMLKADSANIFKNKIVSNLDKNKISEWSRENKRIDQGIREIGDNALKIAEKAEQLGYEARLQNISIGEIKNITELASTNISSLNRKVQEVIGTNSNTTFCCRVTLIILVFVAVSIIIALIFKKLI